MSRCVHQRCQRRGRRRGSRCGAAARRVVLDPREDAAWQRVLAGLPADLEVRARECRALVRRRAVRSAADLLRLLLVYALWDVPFALVAAWGTVAGVATLSDVALVGRARHSRAWLAAVVTAMLAERGGAAPRAGGPAGRIRLVDASVVSGPGSVGTDWRLHLEYDVVEQRLGAIEWTDAHGGERFGRYQFQPHDVAVGDRGYCRAPGIGHVLEQQADVVVRYQRGAVALLAEATGEARLELADWTRDLPSDGPAERTVWLDLPATEQTPPRRVPLRLVAGRLDPQTAAAARRRLRQRETKHGRTPSHLSLELAGVVLLLTSLDAAGWPTDAVLALYRFRWQIELVFKRLKSLLHLDHLRAHDPDIVQTYLWAKLLAAVLLDGWAVALAPTLDAWAADPTRPCSRWRWCRCWLERLLQAVLGPSIIADWEVALPRLRRFLCDSPRRRPAQAAAGRCLHDHPSTHHAIAA